MASTHTAPDGEPEPGGAATLAEAPGRPWLRALRGLVRLTVGNRLSGSYLALCMLVLLAGVPDAAGQSVALLAVVLALPVGAVLLTVAGSLGNWVDLPGLTFAALVVLSYLVQAFLLGLLLRRGRRRPGSSGLG